MRLLLLVALVFAVGCVRGRDSLADGAPLPPGQGFVLGKFDFSKVNWETRMGIRQVGHHEIVLQPLTPVFGIPLPPGRYKVEYIYAYRSDYEELFFEVAAGEAVYIGSWYAVLGMNADLKDERRTLAPEFERRWGVTKFRNGMPGKPRVIIFEVDFDLADWPGPDSGGFCD